MLYSPSMSKFNEIDRLSDTLMKMKLEATEVGAVDAGGDWALEIPAQAGFKLTQIIRGESFVSVTGMRSKFHLKAGDCFLSINGKAALITSKSPAKKKLSLAEISGTVWNGVITINGGGDYFGIGTRFHFDGPLSKIIFANLPPAIHIPGHLEQAALLRWNLDRFTSEFISQNMGRSLILNHLAPIMLIQILRIYASSTQQENNWLNALSDPCLSKAIEAIHSNYQRSWSLEKLARVAGMSRSVFARSFKQQVGIPPMDYLTHWRIEVACDLLKSKDQNVSSAASNVGFESESGFSSAFYKILKVRPGFYQKTHTK